MGMVQLSMAEKFDMYSIRIKFQTNLGIGLNLSLAHMFLNARVSIEC